MSVHPADHDSADHGPVDHPTHHGPADHDSRNARSAGRAYYTADNGAAYEDMPGLA
jgi:hypothetical protein